MAIPLKFVMKKRMRSDSGLFDDQELEVAEILLQLPQFIAQERDGSPSPSPSPLFWGSKKRRSKSDSSPSPPPRQSSSPTTPPFPPLLPHLCNSRKSTLKDKSNSSPTTPLSFSPSESDSKQPVVNSPSESDSKQPVVNSPSESDSKQPVVVFNRKKKTKQDLLEDSEKKLTQDNRILQQEIPKLKAHYEMLKLNNFLIKRKIISCGKQKEHSLNPSGIKGLEGEEAQEVEVVGVVVQEAEGVMERMASGSGNLLENCSSSSKEECKVECEMARQLSPVGVPDDINCSGVVEEGSFRMDDFRGNSYEQPSRAEIATQNRRRRMEMNRLRSNSMAGKPRSRDR